MSAYQPHDLRQPARGCLAACLCVCVLLVSFLAVGSDLHGLVHADAGSVNHHCVISVFADGQIHLTQSVVAVAPAGGGLVCAARRYEAVFVPVPGFSLLPERAPPISSGC